MFGFYVDDDPLPAWAREAIVYQVFVDRFNPGPGNTWKKPANLSGFYGGKLIGITDKLDYIRSLGANVIWLSPIFPSPTHHGYDTTNLFEIEPRFGKKDDLRKLIDAAHLRGMRVLLDLVPNHWSDRHYTFVDAIKNPSSPFRDWYVWHKYPEKYESFFGVRSLPQLNLGNSETRKHVLDAAAYWLEFGVDGYRLDYAIGPTPDFWADFRQVTRKTKPDCWTFGEVVDPSDRQLSFEGLLDGCLDFVLLEAMRQTFAFGRWDAERFATFLERHENYFPETFSRPSFLDNHDMNRFLWACDGDQRKLRLAALCQYTLSNPPVLYYGTEVGLSQERDIRQGPHGIPEEARQPMLWGSRQDQELLEYYRGLGALRNEQEALIYGERKLVRASEGILAYTRGKLLVVINLTDAHLETGFEGAWGYVLYGTDPDAAGGQSDGLCQVSLPPYGGVVMV
jgi:glycosidase